MSHGAHHHHRPISPPEEANGELIEFARKDEQLGVGESLLGVQLASSLADKPSALGHSQGHQPVAGPADVTSQGSFETSGEDSQDHEARKQLRPLKSALSKPGGRGESQHMKITFAPEVADDPAEPTAKRSSEVTCEVKQSIKRPHTNSKSPWDENDFEKWIESKSSAIEAGWTTHILYSQNSKKNRLRQKTWVMGTIFCKFDK